MANNETKNTALETETAEAVNAPENVTIWDTKLGDIEAWQIARKNLNAWLDESEADIFGKFFESKASKSSPFSLQNVAIMAHTSAGYVGDKWKKAKEQALKIALDSKGEYDEARVIEAFICDMLAPNLAEERAKRDAERLEAERKEAERLASIKGEVNARLGIFDEYGIPKNEATLTKAYKSMATNENKEYIICTLANVTLGSEKAGQLAKTLGIEDFAGKLVEV